MKIALISPRGVLLSNDPGFRKFWKNSIEIQFYKRFWSGLSPALLVVAALTPKKIKIELIDENIDPVNFNKDYDLVVLTAMTQQAIRAYQIADEFRRRRVKVVMGGIHPTLLPKEAKTHCDTVIVGEAENTWPRFIKDFLRNDIKPFYISEEPAALDKSPIPRYDLLKPGRYKITWIQTTRGCPYDCEFCAASRIFGTKFRYKSIKQVIQEVKSVKLFCKDSWIGFGDDNMFVNRKYSYELLERLTPLKIRWMTQTDISIANDKKLLKLLHKSGCYILFIGFESISKKSLASVDRTGFKFNKLHRYKEYIKKIQNAGIGIMGAFVLGFDNDSPSIFKKTSDFIVNNHLYAAQITVLTPLSGTRLRSRLQRENRLLPNNWDNYTFWDVNFIPRRMSINELQRGLLEVYKAVYNKKVLLEKSRYFKEIYAKRKF